MEEILEIVLQAIDDASSVFSSVTESAQDMGDTLSDAADGASGSFDGVESSADSVSDAVGGIDGSGLEDVAQGADDASSSSETAGDALGEVATILGGLAGIEAFEGISNSLMDMANAAGSFEDSVMRAGLEAEGAGIPVGEMKDAVSDLSDVTGRAGGQIRESFIKATARGVTDMDSFKTMMQGAGAQATLFGTDIQSMGNKFSNMAMRSTLMEKQLSETGITMEELASAMGMTGATADEVKEKWSELDANQRAAILGTAASMNEGKDANDAYKNSWAGLNEKLDVAKGRIFRLAGEVLLPVLIPAIDIASRILSTLGDVISGLMSGPFGGLISVVGSAAAAFALAVPAFMAVKAAMTFLVGPALAAAGSLWAAVAPLLPFIAIGAAIVFIIYEIGKAFGWWSDVGSMLDAIQDGLTRLWNAFINHPDVQAAIKAITDGFNWLVGAVGNAWNEILKFFNISSDNKFDVVRALIDGLGAAWQFLSFPIRMVIQAVQAFAGALSGFWNDSLVPFGEWLNSVFAPVWTFIGETINAIMPYVQGLTSAFTSFQNGQMDLPGLIMSIMTNLWNIYMTILSRIVNAVINWASGIVSNAVSGATQFVQGIIARIMALPGRFLTYLNMVKLRIMVQMLAWVTLAKARIAQFVNGIISKVTQLPGKVYNVLVGVVSRIRSAIQKWVDAAKQKAQGIVNGVGSVLSNTASAVSSALSSVKDAIVKPFQEGYDRAKKLWDDISSLGGFLGGEEGPMGGETSPVSSNVGYSTGNQSIDVNHNITLDLVNVPAQIDTNTLISMLRDPTVLRALTGNPDFQTLDARVKEKLNLKQIRSRGR